MTKIISPYAYQYFEADIDTSSSEYQSGQLKLICPYTGKAFFTGAAAKNKKKALVLKKVRSPYTGQFFTADIDIEALLTGDIHQTILSCPYTGKTFTFGISPLQTEDSATPQHTINGFQMILDPTVQKFFKVYSLQGRFPTTTVSPYTGSPILLPTGNDVAHKLSQIEKNFNHISLKNKGTPPIYQFGYNIFFQEVSQVDTNPQHKWLTQTQQKDRSPLVSLLSAKSNSTSLPYERRTFEPLTITPVSPDYIIGPDDEITITIWGKAQQELSVLVSRDGKILLPEVGPIYVWGKTFKETTNLIKKEMSQHYSNIKLNITMGRLRTIRVFVLGDVFHPGGYILSSRATAFHALFRAKGPSKAGSLRNITIKKHSGKIVKLDLYDLLLKGDISKDVSLDNGDIIFVNTIGDTIAIAGEIKKPAIYEIDKSILISDAIAMAGGFLQTANTNNLQLIRLNNRNIPIIHDINLNKDSETILKAGDLLFAPLMNSLPANYILLEGYASNPGEYAFTPKMSLQSLLKKSGSFLPNTYMKRIEIIRKTKGNYDKIISLDLSKNKQKKLAEFRLRNKDKVRFFAKKEVLFKKDITIRGSVQNPGTYTYYENMTINDLVFAAGGLSVEPHLAIAEIYTKTPDGLGQIKRIPYIQLPTDSTQAGQMTLTPTNLLIIRGESKTIGTNTMQLKGSFKNPGEYIILPGDHLSDLIERAGGFKKDAFLEGAKFLRDTIKKQQEAFAQKVILQERQNLLKEEAVLLKGSSSGDTSTSNRSKTLSHRKELLELLAAAKISGRILINIADLESFKMSDQDIPVKNGDQLIIPSIPATVQVLGSVYNNAAVLYEYGRGSIYYIEKMGGFTPGANRKGVYIIRSSGEVDSNFSKIKRINRGDTIIIPESFKYKTPQGLLIKETVELFYRLSLGVAVVTNLN
jgi:protein involved in polysaccharide export with SLBB domain